MKKIILKLSVVCNVLLIACVTYFGCVYKTKQVATAVPKAQQTVYKIALLTPVTHPSLQQIQQGFIDTLKASNKADYTFDVFNANGNRMLMRSQAEEIVCGNYDLICTVGAQATQLTKEISIKKQKLKPIVFVAVNDPVRLNLVNSLESSGNHVTGTTEIPNYPLQLKLLTMFKPTIKNLLLVYNPTEGEGKEDKKVEIEKILNERGIALKTVEVYNTSDVYQKANTAVSQADAVLILKDNTVVRALDSLVKLCARYNVPLMATDLESVDRGAVFGFGVYERDFGVGGAQLAQQILEEGKKPLQVPCQPLRSFIFKVNKSQLQKQGIQISKEQQFLLSSSQCIEGN